MYVIERGPRHGLGSIYGAVRHDVWVVVQLLEQQQCFVGVRENLAGG